jgi:hypothetical protein
MVVVIALLYCQEKAFVPKPIYALIYQADALNGIASTANALIPFNVKPIKFIVPPKMFASQFHHVVFWRILAVTVACHLSIILVGVLLAIPVLISQPTVHQVHGTASVKFVPLLVHQIKLIARRLKIVNQSQLPVQMTTTVKQVNAIPLSASLRQHSAVKPIFVSHLQVVAYLLILAAIACQ